MANIFHNTKLSTLYYCTPTGSLAGVSFDKPMKMTRVSKMLQNTKWALDLSLMRLTQHATNAKRIYWMKNDPIMTVLIRHVTAKQAYQIRGIAESTALQSRPLAQLQSSVGRLHMSEALYI